MTTTKGLALATVVLVGILFAPATAEAQCSSMVTPPPLQFDDISSLPTVQDDSSTTISVTCQTGLLGGVFQRRVCVSLPAGTSGISIADRRMASGGHQLAYQAYSDAAHSVVWGETGSAFSTVQIDFNGLSLGLPVTRTVTAFGLLAAGQGGLPAGTYESTLTPVVRWQDRLILLDPPLPSCASITGNTTSLPAFTVRATVTTACTVDATDMAFGTVSGLAAQTAVSNVLVDCSSGAPYAVTLNAGTFPGGSINDRRMRLGGTGPATVEYQLYRDSTHTQVFGNDASTDVEGVGDGTAQSVPVYGLVTGTGTRPTGTYTDTITVTVSY